MNVIGLLRTLERVTRPPTRPTFSDTDDPLTDEMRDEGWEFTTIPEPALTSDELVGVRGLLQKRYEDPEARERNLYEELFLPDRACRPAQSRLIGGIGSDGKVVYPPESSASNHAGTGAEPAPSPTIVQSAPPPTVDGEGPSACEHSPAPAEGRPPHPVPREQRQGTYCEDYETDGCSVDVCPDGCYHALKFRDDAAAEWVGWAVPAISTVLHEHYPQVSKLSGRIDCDPGTENCPMWDDEQAWLEHVAPLIANALAPQDK